MLKYNRNGKIMYGIKEEEETAELEQQKYQIFTLDKRPDFIEQTYELNQTAWPEFMLHDKIADTYWEKLIADFSRFQVCVCDRDEKVIAVGNTIPFIWDGRIESLPAGWDRVFEYGMQAREKSSSATALSALGIAVHPAYRNQGISNMLLREMRKLVENNQFQAFVAPVRPILKSKYPLTPIENYIHWHREDNAPFDPWIRLHWKLGAKILCPIQKSMVIKGTVNEWEEWTNMRFPETGQYIVPGALQPIKIDVEKNFGIYEDPNIWMRHI
ncbi:GNAT family N-acetyltransferase [Aneurinibacillus aneurinilyticus]|uniref:GNAT family N-acetyltransferase n=1 Tax=Aneurinibacillus aneurinilyticus TaxID=1391 RepID=UPI002E24C801|nr:GNAT family N-acetyltransferase [Aneurinibacillus aneurinilyticus]MED0672799.1 GNAT family N-acetyltransferase [Aneurinibacillus aneurinilyticus]